MFMKNKIILSLIYLVLFNSCSHNENKNSNVVKKIYKSYDHILSEFDKVELYRVGPKEDNYKYFYSYSIYKGPDLLAEKDSIKLSRIFLDEKSYKINFDDGSLKLCEFNPGLAFRFYKGKEVLDILLCFQCDEIKFYHNQKLLGQADVDPARADLVNLSKQLFPKDKVIQLLMP